MKLSILLLAVLATLAGSTLADNSQADAANQFVDAFLTQLKAKKDFDPMVMGEHESHIKERIGFLDLDIKVVLHKTVLTGFGHAVREGSADVNNAGGGFNAKIKLGDDNAKAVSDLTIYVGPLIHPDVTLTAEIGHLDVFIAVEIKPDGTADVSEFRIDELKDAKVHVHSEVALMDPMISVMTQAFFDMFNGMARDILTQALKPSLIDALKKLMGPHNGGN